MPDSPGAAAAAAAPTPDARTLALIDEATKKSGIVWLTVPGRDMPARAVWHLWHEGSAYVVTGGVEQPVPGLDNATTVVVTVRSKDKGGRIVAWTARVRRVEPHTARWDDVVPKLHAKRLNAPDGEEAPERWARESFVSRLTPTGELLEEPANLSTDSHAAPPPATPAATRVPVPFTVTGWRRRRSARRAG